jgi:ABC-type multidrug transport system fused ATPase/permease subunit
MLWSDFYKTLMQHRDLIRLSEYDKCGNIVGRLAAAYSKSSEFFFFPRLMMALWRTYWNDVLACAVYSVLEGATRVASPVVLAFLLHELQSPDSPLWRAYMWGTVICLINLVQVVVHHVLFLISMRNGWNFKNASTAFIFDALMKVKASALSSTSTGKLVNLISNDVSRFDEFLVVIIVILLDIIFSQY